MYKNVHTDSYASLFNYEIFFSKMQKIISGRSESCSFFFLLKENGGLVDVGEGEGVCGERDRRSGGRESCSQYVMHERKRTR